MPDADHVSLLSETASIVSPTIWNDTSRSKLWLYHLHYFDDLLADDAVRRAAWHTALIERWVHENPPRDGNGWEPYPASRRIVNWIAFTLRGETLSHGALQSLSTQVRVLARTLEFHLLGNHLFANAKALVFAGSFFEGAEADHWLRIGLRLLDRELSEQILADGGHFELSPMYHALTLEDLIDLQQLSRIYPDRLGAAAQSQQWPERIAAMIAWLAAMRHPDGEISFFNDATLGQARAPENVLRYAQQFGEAAWPDLPALTHLRSSGFVRLAAGPWTTLFDVGEVGPHYLPGHAHADTLSVEISIGGERLITNSGTSTYAIGPQREAERATAAHSTVTIDGQSSSEMWASFRVGRRARPFDVSSGIEGDALWGEAAHDGYRYLAGRPMHRRRVEVDAQRILIRDWITGGVNQESIGRLQLHPSVTIIGNFDNGWTMKTASGRQIRIAVRNAQTAMQDGFFAAAFGHRVPRPVLTWRRRGPNAMLVETEITL